MYEYRKLVTKSYTKTERHPDGQLSVVDLNALSRDGWELVSVFNTDSGAIWLSYIFKRKID